jgi:excisionase family DNA binding protein
MARAGDGDFYTVTEAAAILAVSRTTVLRWIEEGRLTAFKLGPKTFRIRKTDVEALISPYQSKQDPTTERAVQEALVEYKTGIWANYDPKRVKDALRKSAGALSHLDRERFLKDMHNARAQGSSGRHD